MKIERNDRAPTVPYGQLPGGAVFAAISYDGALFMKTDMLEVAVRIDNGTSVRFASGERVFFKQDAVLRLEK